MIVPVGVGSLAHAIVQNFGPSSSHPARVISAEPDAAPCLHLSLAAGRLTSVGEAKYTSMAGLNCPTVSALAWDDLRAAIRPEDAVVVSDDECEVAVRELAEMGCEVGPCGAATLAAARKVAFGEGDVVVLICTEGPPQRGEAN